MCTPTPRLLRKILRKIFRGKHDFGISEDVKEIKQLQDFDVVSQDDLESLLKEKVRK